MFKNKKTWLILIFAIFIFLFITKSITNMTAIPFHDYDEAHRAEGARNMRLNNYYISPLAGTPYNSINNHSQSYALDEMKKLTPETSRPPLIFSLMAFFSGIFGDYEWVYRLPSFLLGLSGFFALLFFIKKYSASQFNLIALAVAFLAFLTAYDWWHSAQMAHLDTGVSLFTSLALFLLILFARQQKKYYLIAAGISLGLGILSKGPPAILFITPLPYLLIKKKIKIKELVLLFSIAFVTILPWYIPLSLEYGWNYLFTSQISGYVSSPASTKIGGGDPTQSAPIFWYLRWWFDTFRPGIFLFGAFLLRDLIKKNFSWVKLTLLFYIIGGFALFSYAKSKVWWYVLPVIPAICAYLYFSVKNYLIKNKKGLVNLSLVILLSSLPIFLWQTNTVTLAYGLSIILIMFLLLNCNLRHPDPPAGGEGSPAKFILTLSSLFTFAVFISLLIFFFRFPTIIPPNPQIKEIGQYFQTLPAEKCLWVEKDFPYEAILYYSRAGRINYLDEETELPSACQNYLIGKEDHPNFETVYKKDGVNLYKIN